KPKPKHVLVLYVSDFILVTFIFLIMNYLKRGTFILSPDYERLLLIIYGLWFVTALMTGKFYNGFRNYYFAMAQWTKAVVFMAATIAVLVFAFRLFYYSRGQIFGFFVVLIIAEAALYYIYYTRNANGKNNGDIESIDEIKSAIKQEKLSVDIDIEELRSRLTRPIRDKLREVYLNSSPEVFDFLDKTLDLHSIIKVETTIINSSEIFHFETLDERPTRLFINTERINHIRWVNRYFLEVYRLLLPGGYFVDRVHTIAMCKKRFFEKYPKYFSHLFYCIDFIFRRVFPKLSVIKKVYFSITQGKNRAISRAETLGRLCFCGFKIVAEKEIGDDLYFIAQKVKTSCISKSPSYGPLVKFSRLGANGSIVNAYKFRTMHPYSEYLQEYIYETNSLQYGGKFNNDFRVTTLGKFMRRTWLDELPMLYNWFKGDLQLLGVRPLSMQYLSLYGTELQKMRKKVKPGLIPPFYADMPETFDEICESERKYINAYMAHPLKTQWGYFWKAAYNIVVKGVRSS
ncbi:MAG: sugar transferase, partial [Thermodesulfobacteriota bacterium]|nr:sugar transferase [Thermodesulfobacteriota bacterium]